MSALTGENSRRRRDRRQRSQRVEGAVDRCDSVIAVQLNIHRCQLGGQKKRRVRRVLERAPQRLQVGSVTREETHDRVAHRSVGVVFGPDLDSDEMAQERRANYTLDLRKRAEIDSTTGRTGAVAVKRPGDRRHAPHRRGPRATDGENLAEIVQLQHRENCLECVSVDAHRRGDMRGRLSGVLLLLVVVVSWPDSR